MQLADTTVIFFEHARFSFGIDNMTGNEFNVWYLVNGTLEGSAEKVLAVVTKLVAINGIGIKPNEM